MADEHVDSGLGTAGTRHWPLADHIGSIRDVIQDDGTVELHRLFDAFGNATVPTGDPEDYTPLFGYTARPFDANTLLQNNLHRWYDALVAKWLKEDPIGLAGWDANLYRYVGNQPSNQLDPDGLKGILGDLAQNIGQLVDDVNNLRKDVNLTVSGLLSGDAFDKRGGLVRFNPQGANECRILLMVNGIKTPPEKAQEMLKSINSFGVKNPKLRAAVSNGSHYAGLGDVLQIAHSELSKLSNVEVIGPGLAAVRLAKQIKIAAAALNNNKDTRPEDREIIVVAHSQGTEISAVAFRLLDPKTKEMISFYGNGGETVVPENGLKFAANIRHPGDPVPEIKDSLKGVAKLLAGIDQAGKKLLAGAGFDISVPETPEYRVYEVGVDSPWVHKLDLKWHGWENYAPLYANEGYVAFGKRIEY